jgi:hypothetical protein
VSSFSLITIAIQIFQDQKALVIKPDYVGARNTLGVALFELFYRKSSRFRNRIPQNVLRLKVPEREKDVFESLLATSEAAPQTGEAYPAV